MEIYHYYIKGLNTEDLEDAITFVNTYGNSEDVHFVLHVDSKGGYITIKDILVNIFNRYSHEINLHIACSSAFEMLLELNGNIRINDFSYGMYHLGSMLLRFKDGMKPTNEAKNDEDQSLKEYARLNVVMDRLEFTKSERKQVLDQRDVFFDSKRLREMFKDKIL